MTRLLTSTWMTVVIGAVMYAGATFVFWKSPVPTAIEEESAPVSSVKGPSWDFLNPEADQLMTELRAEKKLLEKREQDLNELAVRLQSEKSEMNQVTQAVYQSQMEFDKTVLRVQEEEIANLKKLAKVYAAMSAPAAATIFTAMDDTSIVKILLFMKESETAAVLEAFSKKGTTDAKRAADLSERVRMSVFRNSQTK